jgi:hypothetical protein
MIGLVSRVALLFGGSLPVLRMFPAIAGALLVALTMLMTWRLGGGKFAQALAGVSVLLVPIYLVMDSLMTMNAFEPLFWMGCIYFVIRIVETGDSRLWLWFGVLAGFGLMNKHSTGFFGVAVVIGLLLTEHRREFTKPWIWIAAVIALLIFSPNLIWQIHHHFPTLEDLHNVKVTGKNVELGPVKFILQQILVMHPLLSSIWAVGLWHFMLGRGSKFRILGWIFLAFFAMMMALHGKDYYVIPMYPVLFAGGAVAWENAFNRWLFARGKAWPKVAFTSFIVINCLILVPIMLPLLSPEKYVAYARAIHFMPPKQEVHQESQWPQPWADQFGWPELVSQVAQVYNSLPPEERSRTGILTGNYGEAGAINLFGPKYGLPTAMSGHQTYYYWGTQGFSGDNLITLEYGTRYLNEICTSVDKAATHFDAWGMGEENEPIYICRGLKKPLAEIWADQKHWN